MLQFGQSDRRAINEGVNESLGHFVAPHTSRRDIFLLAAAYVYQLSYHCLQLISRSVSFTYVMHYVLSDLVQVGYDGHYTGHSIHFNTQ